MGRWSDKAKEAARKRRQEAKPPRHAGWELKPVPAGFDIWEKDKHHPERIAAVLAELRKAWSEHPEYALMDLLHEANMYYAGNDKEALVQLRKFRQRYKPELPDVG